MLKLNPLCTIVRGHLTRGQCPLDRVVPQYRRVESIKRLLPPLCLLPWKDVTVKVPVWQQRAASLTAPTAHFAAAVTSRLPRIRCCVIARGTNRDGDTRSVAHSEMTCHGQLHTGFTYSPIAFHSQVMEKGEQSLQKQDATSGAFEIPKQKPVTGATGKHYATCSILKWALKKWKKN